MWFGELAEDGQARCSARVVKPGLHTAHFGGKLAAMQTT